MTFEIISKESHAEAKISFCRLRLLSIVVKSFVFCLFVDSKYCNMSTFGMLSSSSSSSLVTGLQHKHIVAMVLSFHEDLWDSVKAVVENAEESKRNLSALHKFIKDKAALDLSYGKSVCCVAVQVNTPVHLLWLCEWLRGNVCM